MFKENDANTSPDNPAHGEALGATFSLKLNALSPGETKRVTLTVKADAYSIGLIDSPDVRLWVKDIPNYYHQDDFNGAADNVNGSQTFGEKLQVYLPTDVYSRTHWEWDSDKLEGWTPLGAATVMADEAAKAMLLGGEGDDPGALGPVTKFSAKDYGAIELRAKRTGGAGRAKLYFTTEGDPAMNEEKALEFDVPDDDAFHVITVDGAKHALWAGTITSLRIDPFEAGPGTLELDYVRALWGGDGVGPGPSGGASGGNAAEPADAEGSCSCEVPGGGARGSSPWSAAGALAAAALFIGARRNRRGGRGRR